MNRTYNLTLTEDAYQALMRLKEKAEEKTFAELLRKALATYDALTEAIVNGEKVFIHRKNGTQHEITFEL